jgi:hypothetical protein
MPYIRSANPDFKPLEKPDTEYGYVHGAERRQGSIPMAFQVTSPFDRRRALLPHALVMHVNPANFNETYNKKIEKIQTRGGWVEQHWFDELSDISADGSTGAFVNLYTGLSSVLRQRTIAWDRYRDLYDLFHNNGSVYDPYGAIVLQGNIMLLYDRGIYIGTFRSFDVDETDDSPFAFKISWTFKVEEIIMKLPGYITDRVGVGFPRPDFQAQNTLQGRSDIVGGQALTEEQARNQALKVDAEAQAAKAYESGRLAESETFAPSKSEAGGEKKPAPKPAPSNPNARAPAKASTAAPTKSPTPASPPVPPPPGGVPAFLQPNPQSRQR